MPSLSGRDLLVVAAIVVALAGSFAAIIAALLAKRDDRRRAEERRLASMGAATARILHQVKNPLQTIILHADLLRESSIASDPKARGEVSAAIASEAQRLAAMLAELSVYASGAGRVLQREPFALHELIHELARNEAREARLVVDASRVEECTVAADAYYLRQALENLIANARDAMQGQPGGRMTIELERTGGSAVVEVIDTGPGIPPDRYESIFQPFVSGKSKGMGLGLAISREIVQGHGGRIEVRSMPGQGSRFRVILPLYEGGPVAAQPSTPDRGEHA
jgi:two-component system sensor histidine kinase HydH